MSSKSNKTSTSSHASSSLSALQPVDDAPFKRPSSVIFVWLTVFISWMLSLLPWRAWEPAPELLLLVIAFWCLHEPRKVNLLTAFIFGLLMDVHDAALLGTQALSYILVAYGVLLLSRRLLYFNAVVQAIHLVPVFVISMGIARLPSTWAAGGWMGWSWLGA